MSTDGHQAWEFVPHQHKGPAMQTGKDDHVRSPTQHNGAFKASGLNTFMGAPYCEPDRHKIRAMGAKVCFLGVPHDHGNMVRCGTFHECQLAFVKPQPSISRICSIMT